MYYIYNPLEMYKLWIRVVSNTERTPMTTFNNSLQTKQNWNRLPFFYYDLSCTIRASINGSLRNRRWILRSHVFEDVWRSGAATSSDGAVLSSPRQPLCVLLPPGLLAVHQPLQKPQTVEIYLPRCVAPSSRPLVPTLWSHATFPCTRSQQIWLIFVARDLVHYRSFSGNIILTTVNQLTNPWFKSAACLSPAQQSIRHI
jgi:hypothetical protein